MNRISKSSIVEIQIQNLFRSLELCGEYTPEEQELLVMTIKRIFEEVQNG